MKKRIFIVLIPLLVLIVSAFVYYFSQQNTLEAIFIMNKNNSKYEKIRIPVSNQNKIIFNLKNIDLNIFYQKDNKNINVEYEKTIGEKLSKNEEENIYKEFNFYVNSDNESIVLNSDSGKNMNGVHKRGKINIYVGQNFNIYSLNVESGKIRIYDSYNGVIIGDIKNSALIIEKIYGVLCLKGNKSGVQIRNGKLMLGTDVCLDSGNITIKSDFTDSGTYFFETLSGNISVCYKLSDTISAKQIYSNKHDDYEDIWKNDLKKMSHILAYTKDGLVSFDTYIE